MMLKSLRSFSLTKPLPLRSRTLTRLTSLVPFALALWRFEEYIFSILYFVNGYMSLTPTGYGDIFPTSTLAASSAGSPCHLRPVITATLQLCASRSTLWNSLVLFYLFPSLAMATSFLSASRSPRPYLLDYHGTYLNWLWRHFPCPPHMELGMATVALCDLRITFSAVASLTSLVTATSVLCASRSTFSFPSLLLHPHLRCRHLLEHYANYAHWLR